MEENKEEELDYYGDGSITSRDAKIPRWLFWSYVLLAIWGIFWGIYFFNGVHGWLDRGHWEQLEKAANTTFQ